MPRNQKYAVKEASLRDSQRQTAPPPSAAPGDLTTESSVLRGMSGEEFSGRVERSQNRFFTPYSLRFQAAACAG
jgi:hypothetical protein